MDWQWVVDIFTFLGISVSVIAALMAIVWLTCFVAKLLVKTFGIRVGKSYDLMVEDINKKAEAKKARNEIKRKAALDKKMEILNMKLENKQKIHELKKAKLETKLENKEKATKIKLFGDENFELKAEKKPLQKPEKKEETVEKPKNDVQEVEEICIQDMVDGDVQTIEAIVSEEEIETKEKPVAKKKQSKK